jgi:tetratricopeptide (TPR) repeat protein
MPPGVWPKAVPLLILAGLLAYANCVSKTLVFDDDAWIGDHPELEHPLAYFKSMEGRPLLAASILALHQVGRNNPLAHHVLNVLVHIATGLTLYGLVRRTLLAPRFDGRYADRAPCLAFGAALLWLLHPIQVQCVTYVIQRGESMAGLFYLLILYALVRANEDASRWRVAWYALSVVSLVLGFGSKEILASAPAAVILFDRVFLSRSVRELVRRRWLYYLVLLLVWGAFTGWHLTRATQAQGGIGFNMELTPKKYALTEAGVILYYLQISVWPRGLAIDYQSWPWSETLSDAMPDAAIVGGLLVLTAICLFWRPALGFVCAWFFIVLAPTSSVLPIVDAVFEHRLYLSLASVTILAVFFGDWLLRTIGLGRLRPYVLASVAVALGVLTHLRNEEYRNRAEIWTVAVNRMPDSVRARANLAQGLIAENRTAEVIPLLERALELSPTDPTSLQNLAAAHEILGDFASAAEFYQRLAEYYPKEARHWRMYGASLLVLGRWAEAADAYEKAIERDENMGEARYGRAAALFELGRDAEAEREIGAATAINKDWPAGALALARGVIMDEKARDHPAARRSALTWARLGIRYLETPSPTDLDTLGLCYAANGDFVRAAEQSRWSLLMEPDGPWGSLHRDRIRDYERKRLPWEE